MCIIQQLRRTGDSPKVAAAHTDLSFLHALDLLQVYGSYSYRRDLTNIVKVPGMLSRARSLTRGEAEAEEAQVGKLGSPVGLHPPSMRQAIAWELALRNIRQAEVSHLSS